ncbi:CBS domain-containing protein [Parafilimonas terrae]|uniref:CBS domain-containing protein n=1 Tax=Parafilimonas terrae TaxID=1465490 RepID=A0A1I5WX38_9BACT|nr:CBS domain-containing protein [Parafilimonas terrae]SFQ24244.1 CBS domain-containing protein [Parafilimonas terrae]
MLASEIIQPSIPVLHYDDTINDAIDLLQQNNIDHLAVLNNDNYEGLLSMDELLSAENADIVSDLSDKFLHISVQHSQHLLTALKVINEAGITALPVLSQNKEYIGVVTYATLVQNLGMFLSTDVPGGLFVIETEKHKFSIGELCRLVETNDAFVTEINTYIEHVSGQLIVIFKINKTEVSDVLATLQRFDYNVRYYFGEELFENDLRANYDNLMAYLNV